MCNAESTVKKDIVKISLKPFKKIIILKVLTTCKTNQILCSFYNEGICKAGPDWMFDHTDLDCETHIRRKSCRSCCKTKWFKDIVTIKTTVLLRYKDIKIVDKDISTCMNFLLW